MVGPTSHLLYGNSRGAPAGAYDHARRLVLASEPAAQSHRRRPSAQGRELMQTLGLSANAPANPEPLLKTAFKYANIIVSSLAVEQVGLTLGCTRQKVGKMLKARALYSYRIDQTCYVPDFQFEGEALVPGIAEVNPALPAHLHPVAIYNWYHLPNPDLCLEDDAAHTLSPLTWLRLGGDPQQAALLAEHL